jgi:hypothetical protein
MVIIDSKVIEQLREIGKQVKALLPDVNGSVQINVARDLPHAKVNLNLADVTEAKK